MGMHTLFSFMGCSEASMSMALLKAVLQIWLFLTTLLFEMSILCNLFCAIGGSAVGILLSMLCVIGLIMWATSEAAGNLSQIINPMWLSADIIENMGSYIKKLLVLLIKWQSVQVFLDIIWQNEICSQGKEKADDTRSET